MTDGYYVPFRCKRIPNDKLEIIRFLIRGRFKRRTTNISCIFHEDAFRCLMVSGERYKCTWCKKNGLASELIKLIERHIYE